MAEIDCTGEGKLLCDEEGVTGFPTLKYGNPADLEDYNGGRFYEDLSKFAVANLKPICSPFNLDLCDATMRKKLETFMEMNATELDEKIKEEEQKLKDAQKVFQEAVADLQKEYQKIAEEKDEKLAAVKEGGLGLLKSIRAAKKKEKGGSSDKDEL